MKTIMAKTPQESSSFSFSRRYLHLKKKPVVENEEDDDMEEILNFTSRSTSSKSEELYFPTQSTTKPPRKKLSAKLWTTFTLGKARTHFSSGLGTKVVGTLFGNRRGHVHFSFQQDYNQIPAFLIEIATPTSVLVKEMASGVVRIALECDKKVEKKGVKLLQEPIWRSYCNGKKCGYGMKRECGGEEWKVLNAIGAISMGAGVLPGVEEDGELMYMRAKFERVKGSKDSEAFYMINPDGNGGPELSIYLMRV
ncbi:hypothetical protein ACJIZ3_020083 [Penstemon smallii]|uniref:Protein MIZU-KUSSEI 1-like n=1 Tax=Penstemon smallii TaxID=265156 RepID=A0ABD3SHQ3_9LAMI